MSIEMVQTTDKHHPETGKNYNCMDKKMVNDMN